MSWGLNFGVRDCLDWFADTSVGYECDVSITDVVYDTYLDTAIYALVLQLVIF